jgi:hypothetical protein
MKTRALVHALLVAFTSLAHAATFHVTINGNDAWSGRLAAPNADMTDGPLASLVGARNAIRKLPSRDHPITVSIADGRYPLLEPVLFESTDSGTPTAPIVYAAAPGAKPLFSGGVSLSGWSVTPEGLWKTRVPVGVRSEQLWVNGQRSVPATVPAGEPWLIRRVDEQILPARAPELGVLHKFLVKPARQSIYLDPLDVKALAETSADELRDARIMIFHKWNASPRRVLDFDAASGRIDVEGGAMQPWSDWRSKNAKLRIENVRAGLSTPGSWYQAADGTILYQPRLGEHPETAEAVLGVADKFILFLGAPGEGQFVEHMKFVGLTFRHSRWIHPRHAVSGDGGIDDLQAAAHIDAVIMGDGVRHLAFENCEISSVSRNAMWFRRGCSDVSIERSTFRDLGAGAIRIGDYLPPRYPFERTSRFVVRNNQISEGGRTFPSATGIVVMQADNNHIAHNEIHDFFYSGISVGWSWGYLPTSASDNTVEFNRVSKIGQGLLSDMAGIYFLGPGANNVCRNNVITDVTCHAYGGWGIYADEGSTGVLYENNLIVGTQSGGFHQNYGRGNIVRNNIFAYGAEMQVTRPRKEDHLSYTFERNIVIFDSGRFAGGRSVEESGTVAFENNLYHASGVAEAPFTQELAERRAQGLDATSTVADPLFIDPKSGDFRLRSESPAHTIGFVPFDYTKAGIQPK